MAYPLPYGENLGETEVRVDIITNIDSALVIVFVKSFVLTLPLAFFIAFVLAFVITLVIDFAIAFVTLAASKLFFRLSISSPPTTSTTSSEPS